MKRGSIVLTKFPFTDLSTAKRRPGIIVSANLSDKSDVIIAFISSVVPVEIQGTDFLMNEDHIDFSLSGLKKSSVIKLDKLATINTSIVTGEIGYLNGNILSEIDSRLKLALGLK